MFQTVKDKLRKTKKVGYYEKENKDWVKSTRF
jgi:hypothetical protein